MGIFSKSSYVVEYTIYSYDKGNNGFKNFQQSFENLEAAQEFQTRLSNWINNHDVKYQQIKAYTNFIEKHVDDGSLKTVSVVLEI